MSSLLTIQKIVNFFIYQVVNIAPIKISVMLFHKNSRIV